MDRPEEEPQCFGLVRLRATGRIARIRSVDRAETGPHGFQCAWVHLLLHPFKQDPFFFPNVCLQTLAKSTQPFVKISRGVLLKLSDSRSHIVMFFTQLADQVVSVSELFRDCRKEVLFFRLEVSS